MQCKYEDAIKKLENKIKTCRKDIHELFSGNGLYLEV